MKKMKPILLAILMLVLLLLAIFVAVYFTRIKTMSTIRQITEYPEYNLYSMDVEYDYDLDRLIAYGIEDNQSFTEAILKEALPYMPVHIESPDFGCSAFTMVEPSGNVLMGRNYDFKNNTSAMLVYCAPRDGYKSVAFAALDNASANQPLSSLSKRMACLTAPFICLDGMNEKGVSIAVLTLDSEPTHQKTGQPTIGTTLAIRLVLDRADTTQKAVELLSSYDMFATSGRDYHFYITDASGDGRVIEYDCDDPQRKLVDTKSPAVTNFFVMYKEKVLPEQMNGVYGHGRERYDKIEAILEEYTGNYSREIAWKALVAASQEPKEGDVTSNTQWSIVYDDTELTGEVVLRRQWKDVIPFALERDNG